jgi:hypothetical protein
LTLPVSAAGWQRTTSLLLKWRTGSTRRVRDGG